jgi:hypothetical protein
MPKANSVIKINVTDEDQDDELAVNPVGEKAVEKIIPQKEEVVLETAKRLKKSFSGPKKEINKVVKKKAVEKKSITKKKKAENNLNKTETILVKKPAQAENLILQNKPAAPEKIKDKKKADNILDKVDEINSVRKMISENSQPAQNILTAQEEIKNEKKADIATVQKTDGAINNNDIKVSGSLPADPARPKRSIRLYKKIAFSFIFLTIALLAVVTYFLIVKVTIILIPNQERMSNNMIVDIKDKDKNANSAENSIKGVVTLLNMEQKAIFTASGTEVIGEEAVGKVKIINNYTKNQPLVASTRLLTPDGNKLFRLKNTVNIPAGGSVDAEIYADNPTPDSAVGPTKFTFPGLWAGLQDKIYAENSEPVVYQQKLKRKITQADIDMAIQDLRNKISDDAKLKVNETYKDYSQIIYKIDEDSVKSEIEGKVGDEKDYFNAKMEANVIVVAFIGSNVAALAKQKFISSLPDNKELISFDENNLIYSLNNYSYTDGIATINITFEGKVTLKENSQIIDTNKILGLNKKELDAYLSDLSDIAGYEVIYYPSFIKRMPNLVDRIKIEIKK